MKKFFFIVLLSCTWASISFPSDIFVSIKDNINIREDSTVSAPILGNLSNGQAVEVISESFGWSKIKTPDYVNCYISENFVREIDSSQIKVTGKVVNLRSKPSLDGKIIGTAPENARLKIVGRTDGWIKASGYPYTEGWVHGSLLKKLDNGFGMKTLEAITFSRLNHNKQAEEKAIADFTERGGKYLLPALKVNLLTADTETSYSIISVLTFMGRKNPDIVFYLLESTHKEPIEVAAACLDVAQNVILSDEAKVPYFYKAKNDLLSCEDIEESRKKLQQKYTDLFCFVDKTQRQ